MTDKFATPQVATDATLTIGKILDKDEPRDAIHVAVFSAVAGERISPGENVYLDSEDGTARFCAPKNAQTIGVGFADPYLVNEVDSIEKGQRFWIHVYPRSIQSLRHVWEHPSFPSSQETEDITARELAKHVLSDVAPVGVTDNAREALADWIVNSEIPDEVTVDDFIELLNGTRIPGAPDDDDDYRGVENHGDWVTVRGRDAYGEIPEHVYALVLAITGVVPTTHPTSISCSC